MQTNSEAKPVRARRSWLRFSLRGLFFALTIFCVWFGIKFNAARRQAEAVTAILKAGGTVFYDYQVAPAKPGSIGAFEINANAEPSTPKWLRRVLGDDFFRTVVIVNLSYNPQIADIDSYEPPNLAKIGFDQLPNLPDVKELRVGLAETTDGRNTNLLLPFLPKPKIGDFEFALIGKMEKLESLRFSEIKLNGKEFRLLSESWHLKALSIGTTTLDEQSLSEIGKVKNIKKICLSSCDPQSDLCLQNLRDLLALEEFYALLTPITDKALHALEGMPTLKIVYLLETSVTDDGIRALQKSVPNAKISTGSFGATRRQASGGNFGGGRPE